MHITFVRFMLVRDQMFNVYVFNDPYLLRFYRKLKIMNTYTHLHKHRSSNTILIAKPVDIDVQLPTLPEHLSSHPIFSSVRVVRSFVLYVVFCRSFSVLLSFLFWILCCVVPSSVYGFWLAIWYLLVIVLSVLLRFTDSD